MNEQKPADYVINMALASAAGMSGCVTLMLVLGFLLIGVWVDSFLGTRPLFTVIFILIGIPVALWITLKTVVGIAKQLEKRQYPKKENNDPSFF
jgi:F0F1-type ATP synthase assembly protein I